MHSERNRARQQPPLRLRLSSADAASRATSLLRIVNHATWTLCRLQDATDTTVTRERRESINAA